MTNGLRVGAIALTSNMNGSYLSVLILLLVTMTGTPAATAVPFRTITSGSASLITRRYDLIARTNGTWHVIWYKHRGTYEPPPIDFGREMVVAVFTGRRSNASAVHIVSVTYETMALVVRYSVPADGGLGATIETTPFHILALPADHTVVKFIEVPDPMSAPRLARVDRS
jgi:hypothetical protein